MVAEYNEWRGPLQWKFSGPLSMRNSWWRSIGRDMKRARQARHDLRLFRAARSDDPAHRAASGDGAGRGSSMPPSRTIMRPSPPRGTATAGSSAAMSRSTNISPRSCTRSSRSWTTSSTSARRTSITEASTSTSRSCSASRMRRLRTAMRGYFERELAGLQMDHAGRPQAAVQPVAAHANGRCPISW